MGKDSLVVIFMGSEKDLDHAEEIVEVLDRFQVEHEVRALSAHKLARVVLEELENYDESYEQVIYIAVAGRSNALGPMISAHTTNPVINCPIIGSFQEDLFSSLRTPSAVPCSTILDPGNAAIHAVQILGLSDQDLSARLREWRAQVVESLKETDRKVQEKGDQPQRGRVV
ncbi:MAG: AIR carboxylase family protein [Candidatus Bipolaricaulota bacterium]